MTTEPPDEAKLALELALRITDEAPVDWEATRQSASDLGSTFERLQQLQTLGELHRRRDPQAPGKPLFAWGPLRVLAKLGEGGFGEVWRAWDPALEREVALKLRRAGEPSAGASRWLREAQRLARVRHAHVLTVHGTDIHEGRAGIWTDLVRGRTLEQLLIEQGPLGAREVVAIGLDLCAALAAVHDAGLVHGDVKTRNVMREGHALGAASVAGAGRIVLMDFGTASQRAGGPAEVAGATPLFAAPELLEGGSPSVASDLYALGVLLYRLATGHFPVEAATLAELRARLARHELTPLRTWRPDLPGALVHAIERALAFAPEQRFASAAEMERALAGVFAAPGEVVRARHSLRLQLALLLAGAAAVALAWAGVTWLPGLLKPRFHVRPRGAAAAVRMVQTVQGRVPLGAFGASLGSPGDVDGDGIPDLLVSATVRGDPAARVYLMRGTPEGSFVPWRTLLAPHGGAFGFRIAGLGDVNGDHHPDFAISANQEGSGANANVGAVYLYLGGPALDSLPALRLEGERPSADFGYDVAGAGDVNHDGYADFLVGAPLDDHEGLSAGRAYLYFGGATLHAHADLVLRPTAEGGQFGYSVAGLGDVNGDGIADFAIGANGDPTIGRGSGKVSVYFGGAHPDSVANLNLYAAGVGDWFGSSLCALGDINGDGLDDFAIGAERAQGFDEWGGTVSVYLGAQNPSTRPRFVLEGEGSNSKFAHRIVAADVNGDGSPDVIVGAYGADDNGPWAGSVVVFHGGPSMDDVPDLELVGNSKHGNFGIDLVALKGPGAAGGRTLVVGAPDARPGGEFVVYAFSRYALTSPRRGARWSAAGGGDLAWSGAERAELEWAPAGSRAWRPLAHGVGGREQNVLHVRVPAAARDSFQLRLRASDPHVPGEAVTSAIAVDGR